VTTAVLLSCHGTVDRIEDIPAFLANIRRGRPTPPAIVAEVTHRFQRIGGSPLMKTTAAQAAALAARLGLPVRIAGRLWGPYPAEVIAALVREGTTTLISLPLAPQSVDIYNAPVREAAAAHASEAGGHAGGLDVRAAPPWGLEPALIDAFVETIDEGLAGFPEAERASVSVILSAHSLPQRIIDAGDLYEQQFRGMAAAVAARLAPRPNPVTVAFQSQGMDGGVWLGPDLPATFAALAAGGARSALVAPIGFVADHVETLYDLDIEAPELAAKAGLRLRRAPALNTRPRFIDALEAVVRRLL
jgi:protoporphyrin/coproporphyrin ferrochelatase